LCRQAKLNEKYAVLLEQFDCVLSLGYLLVDTLQCVIENLTIVYLIFLIKSPQKLEDGFANLVCSLNTRHAIEEEASIAENKDEGHNKPKNDEGIRVTFYAASFVAFADTDEHNGAIDWPDKEKGQDQQSDDPADGAELTNFMPVNLVVWLLFHL
jgi:hypothetical protein